MILVANHVSAYDVPLLLYALPFHLRTRVAVAARGEMMEDWRHGRSHPLGPAIFWLLTVLFNSFPLPQSRDFRRSFEHAGEALDRGYSVLVFPEGRRSFGGPVEAFRGGIGLLTREAAVPATIDVLPMALQERRTKRGLRPYTTSVAVGALQTIHAGEDARAITERLEAAVRGLLENN
jgi:long-chain acyl-CoA synthetase